jgi:hypothetical protein
MEVPKDLGRRIVEASRLAVALHLQKVFGLEPQVGQADGETAVSTREIALASFNAASRQLAKREAQ